MAKITGSEPQMGGNRAKLDQSEALALADHIRLQAAKNLTVIAYADDLSLAGRNHAKSIGINIDFGDWDNAHSTIYQMRMLQWPGTPYLKIDDFAACVALIDQYNEFNPSHVISVLRRLDEFYPDAQLTYRLARESSPAIYIRSNNYFRFEDHDVTVLGGDLLADDSADRWSAGCWFWWD